MDVKGQQDLFFFKWPQEGKVLTGLILYFGVTLKMHKYTRVEYEWTGYITTEMYINGSHVTSKVNVDVDLYIHYLFILIHLIHCFAHFSEEQWGKHTGLD